MLKKLFLLSFLLTMFYCYSDQFINLDKDIGQYNVGKFIEYYVDLTDELTIDDFLEMNTVEFTRSEVDNLNFGFSQDVHWIKFNIKNSQITEQEILLEYQHPHMDNVDTFVVRNNKVVNLFHGGDFYAYDYREIDYQNLVYQIFIPPNSKSTIFMKFKTQGSMQIPIKLWYPIPFAEKINKEQLFLGIYFGILIGLLLYNIFLFIFIKDKNYFYYLLYLVVIILLQLGINRLDVEYLWPNFIYFANISFPMFYNLGFIFAGLYSRSFLETKVRAPLLDKLILVFMGIGVIGLLLSFFVGYNAGFFPVLYILAIFEPIILLIAGIVCWKRGFKTARYYTIAWSGLIVSSLVFNLRNITVLPSVFITDYSLYFGTTFEALFLSIALADRINTIKAEILTVQQRFTKELEIKVLDRTLELEEMNKKLSTLSNVDGLTSLYNRRYFDSSMNKEWERSVRLKLPLSLIILDIDHFKLFNDNYGHQAGDDCIKRVAKCLLKSVNRATDIVARYGGEEFAIILPNCDSDGAMFVSSIVQNVILEEAIVHGFSSVSDTITLSIGVSTTLANNDQNFDSLIKLSDDALYISKKSGRNKISILDT
ncbi:MAG: sensor domain-containing diguanylate cyclase [Spirochaetaceae bacterium]